MQRPRVLWFAIGGLVLALAGFFGRFALDVMTEGRTLERLAADAQQHLGAGDWRRARSSLGRLDDAAARASDRLARPAGDVLAFVPILGRTVRTTRTVVEEARVASASALAILPSLEGGPLWRGGRLDLRALRALGRAAETQHPTLQASLDRTARSAAWPLPGPVARSRELLLERLDGATRTTRVAGHAADLFGRLLGGQGTRRYFLSFENPAEMRGAGGLWSNYGILEASDGRLRLGRFGRTQTELQPFLTNEGPPWYHDRYARYGYSTEWAQLPTGPDFPTVASIAEANLADAEGYGPVQGTIAIDPVALSSMLKITGPVRVEGWPEPISSTNVVDATLHDAYSRFESNDQRVAFLSTTAHAVWSAFLSADLNVGRIASSGLGGDIAARHLRLHFSDPAEQQLAAELEADGALDEPQRTFALVTQNSAGNKMDYWLHRAVEVDVQLEADGSGWGTAVVTLENRGPASGEPRYVIGPFDERFQPGWNHQFVRLYLPATASARGDDIEVAAEQGFVVIEWEVGVPPGGSVTREVEFRIDELWDPGAGVLDVVVRKQPSIHPDTVTMRVKPPWGRRLDVEGTGVCPRGVTTTDLQVRASMRTSVLGWVVGPWSRDVNCGVTG